MSESNVSAAKRLSKLLIDSSPLIERYTSALCPSCTPVCCRQEHGLYRERDILYLRGIGEKVPERNRTRSLEGPCEAMGPRGCTQPRWLRPFKCTWFFCEPLLLAMQEGPPRQARQLSSLLQEMVDLYNELKDE